MTYSKHKIGLNNFWLAQPETMEELAFTLENEGGFLDYDPNNIVPDEELLSMFL